ncbi:DUF1310 domain-containing protein [Streptococcus sanguinis]|uniref:DUF1310 family protein n=1 Tax=Streptococcus sanguinis TaxID=1305 RepID=A0A3R9HE67_STRSA|nr:DUF1310 family protein [Streptococcus sanguinis]PLA64164.1 hypothetical protein CYK23_06800 [Streptococcus salivarius]MCY7026089.1 DUF1310 domain-containing protein [Streptococcus sanguinis]RSI23075.1 hypothetical protein D8883_08275 [Streptococcus sanguinis]RSI26488.1 hypothetical protein D8881_03360 [Streptococcus sanguinis]RSI42736.1 hypothetical protein D8875_01470 [Streptococcus sanguinis]
MNKTFLWSGLSILVVTGLIIIGFSMYQNQKKQKMICIATSKEARKVYEEHMRENDPNALTREGVIQSYEIDTETLEYNPMGGLMVRLYFNNNKELDFHFGLIKNDNGDYETYGYTVSPKLSALLKENVK